MVISLGPARERLLSVRVCVRVHTFLPPVLTAGALKGGVAQTHADILTDAPIGAADVAGSLEEERQGHLHGNLPSPIPEDETIHPLVLQSRLWDDQTPITGDVMPINKLNFLHKTHTLASLVTLTVGLFLSGWLCCLRVRCETTGPRAMGSRENAGGILLGRQGGAE